jgi:hypothetical protein
VNISLREIADRYIREAFQGIVNFIKRHALFRGKWEFVEHTASSAGTYKIRHSLRSVPKDVIQTSLTGTGSLSWQYNQFTSEYVEVTTTGACTVRAFIGSYQEELV